jgi:hypothetical protein
MCKDELVFAMASEDMDSLTFGTPRLTRNLMKPANAKVAVNEYEYQKVRALGIWPRLKSVDGMSKFRSAQSGPRTVLFPESGKLVACKHCPVLSKS